MESENLGFRARVMQAASRLVYRRYWLMIAAAVAVTVFSWWSSRKLELKLNFIDMLSPEDPAVIDYQGAVKQFGALSFLFVVVDMEDPLSGRVFAEDLAGRLVENKDFVPRVFYKAEIDQYLDDALLFLKPEELELLAKTAEENREELKLMALDPGLASLLEGVTRVIGGYVARGQVDSMEDFNPAMAIGPLREMVRAAKTYAAEGKGDPAALRQTLLSQVMKADRQLPIDPAEPYILSRDKKHMLMLVSSSRPSEDFEWCRAYMEYVEGKISESMKKYPGQPRPMITGNAAVMRDDNRVIRHDMKLTTLVSFIGIMLLFAFSFRNLSSIVMVCVPLAVGILWTMAAGYWVIGHLTPITAIFGAILMGMGIDYAILILSRYTEERHSGKSIEEALDVSMVQAGVGIIAGALATCLAFFSMTRSSFNGGRELGVMAGMGIIIFVVIMTIVLPALLTAWDRSRKTVGPTQKKWDPKFMRIAATAADQYAVPVAAVFTIVVGAMAVIAPRFEFEYNYTNLEPRNMESIELIHKIPDWFGIDTNYGMVVTRSVEEDRKQAAALRAKKTVARVDAISDFVPTDQELKLEQVKRLRAVFEEIDAAAKKPEPTEPDPVAGDTAAPLSDAELDRLLAAMKNLADAVGAPGRGLVGLFYLSEMEEAEEGARALHADLLDLIATMESQPREVLKERLGRLDSQTRRELDEGWTLARRMTSTSGVTIETFRNKHPELIDQFVGRDGSFLIYAYPSVTVWEEQNLKDVVRELKEVSPNALGLAVLFERILYQIKNDLVRIAVIALGVVFIALLLSYRSLWHSALSLVPLLAGGVTMVGVMNLIGLKFNLINTGMLPLIIGVGVDYGVYVVHRYMAEGKGLGSIRPVVESTGRAVTLAALTTMIGFGSVGLANWRGLALMGVTLTMGIGFCWLAAVLYLPSLLKIVEMVKARKK